MVTNVLTIVLNDTFYEAINRCLFANVQLRLEQLTDHHHLPAISGGDRVVVVVMRATGVAPISFYSHILCPSILHFTIVYTYDTRECACGVVEGKYLSRPVTLRTNANARWYGVCVRR